MVMLKESMFNKDVEERQLGGKIKKYSHLKQLKEIEKKIQDKSPLPITYDVNRTQPWYFEEFTYTEFLGGLFIGPQSDELAVRILNSSVECEKKSHSTLEFINKRIKTFGTGDKYELNNYDRNFDYVAFLPGTNLLTDMVSRELLTKAIWENDKLVLKPHPLTHENDIKMLKSNFGASRILDPMISGFALLKNAKEVYTLPSSELTAYAILMNKKTIDISNFLNVRGCAYFPILHDVIGKPVEEAKSKLLSKLDSKSSGIVFYEDLEWEQQIENYFSLAMKIREQFKPVVWNSFKPVVYKQPTQQEKV